MRTITTIVTTTLYSFNELSDNAKYKVREQYLDLMRDTELFADDCKMYMHELLPNSNLDVQYSLCYMQGDGFNIYGEISFVDLMNVLRDKFTEKERRFLEWAFEESGINTYKIPMSRPSCYCNANMCDFTEDVFDALDYDGVRNIRKNVLDKMTRETIDYIENLCETFKNDGYEYFYEVPNDVLEEWANDFGYEFTEDGDIYFGISDGQ